jgi:hypothetical protein
VCGPVVAAILGAENALAPEDVGQYRIRPPLKPVPLSALAALDRAGDPREPEETT